MKVPVVLVIILFIRSSMQKITLDTEEWKCGVEAGHQETDIEHEDNSPNNLNERRTTFAENYDIKGESNQDIDEKQHRYKRANQEKGLKQKEIDVGLQEALWTSLTTRFVELAIVADNRMYKSYSSSEDKLIKKVQDVVDIVNAIYKDLKIVVVLVAIEIWKDEDQVEVTEFHNRTLTNFKPYREILSKRIHHDNLALFTGVDFLGNTVGFAPIGTMCGSKASVSLNMANSKRGSMSIAETLAHEMGHNLGMDHDWEAEDGVSCICPTKKCVMGGKGDEEDYSPGFQGWSDCSKKFLAKWFSKHRQSCLNDVPTAIMDMPHCGNGVVESGEECDCGHAAECITNCCNTTTCTLIANATCGAGACCDLQTCSPRIGGWECRKVHDDCDLPEYCHGGSSTRCPSDFRKMQGQACPEGHCYHERCGSYNRDKMCRALWGPTANTGKNPCNKLNTEICGAPWCNIEDGVSPAPGGGRWVIQDVENQKCKRFKSRGPSDWRPANGASCGDKKYCVDQSCTSIPAPPEGQCPNDCSGSGVCNNLGNCHCDAGHGPPDCGYPGLGGSVDSGPMANIQEIEEFKMGVYFTFLLVVPLLAILWWLWWNSPLLWTAKRRATVQKHCPCLMTPLQNCCCPIILSTNQWMYDSIVCCRYCYPKKVPQKKPPQVTTVNQSTERSDNRSNGYGVEKQNGNSRSNSTYNQTKLDTKSNIVNKQPKGTRQQNKPNPLVLRITPELVSAGSNSRNESAQRIPTGAPSVAFQPARLSSRSPQGPVPRPGIDLGNRPSRPPQPIVRGPPLMPPKHSNLGQTNNINNVDIHRSTRPSNEGSSNVPIRQAPGPPPPKGRGKRKPAGAVPVLTGGRWDGSKDTSHPNYIKSPNYR